jgi:hypothetical protein
MTLPSWLTHFQIDYAPVPPLLNDLTARGVLWQAAPNRLLIAVPEVARYLVEAGQRISIEAAPNSSEANVNQFLRMTPFAALLYQRNRLAFHAAAAANEHGAILLAGDSGAGKSTLLAALLQRDWQLLADDLSPVDLDDHNRLMVWPTFAEVRLWPDAQGQLSPIDLQARSDLLSPIAQPLRAIYWLSVHTRPTVEVSKLASAECFQKLGTLLYNSHIADALLDRTAYFRLATILAPAIPVWQLRRPRGSWSVPQLIEEIENRSSRSTLIGF